MKKRLASLLCLFGLLLTGCSFSPAISSYSSESSIVSSSSSQPSSSSESSPSETTSDPSSESIHKPSEPSLTSEESEIPSEPSSEIPSSSEGSTSEPSSESVPTSSQESSNPSSEPISSSEESTESSTNSSESSSESTETDDRLYVFVQKGQTEGYYDVYFDAKVDMTMTPRALNGESVIVLCEGVDIPVDDIRHSLYDGYMERVYFGEHITAIGELNLYFESTNPEVHFDKALESIEYLHVSLSYDSIFSSDLPKRIDLYFDGDCPAMEEGSLYNNGFSSMLIHYHEGAKGFTTFMQSASTVCIEDETVIPSLSISEYVLESNRAAREMAKALYKRSVAAGNDEFLLFPISGLEFYFELKDFALDLTKDCVSAYDKAHVLFDWIVANIEYDDDYLTATVEEVFSDRKAVCAGYSFLYHDMLSAVGIPSFYTRGAPISKLPQDDIDSFVRATLDSSQNTATHGWVYAIIDGKAVCCDPTWGDFDMSDEYLSATRLIYQVDDVHVLCDDRLYRLLDMGVVYCDDEFYLVQDGAASGSAQLFSTINFVLNFSFQVNRNSKVTHGAESFDSSLVIPYGAIYHDGLFYYTEHLVEAGIQNWRYCMSNGKAIDFILLLRYMGEEQLRYGTTFKTQFDLGFCSFDDKMVYYEYKPGELMVLACFVSVSSLSVPAEVNGKKVTSLGASCFRDMDGLKEVVLPDGLQELVNSCFHGCTSLTTINIPSSVKTIGGLVFSGCKSLESIEFPEGIDTMANGVFERCTSLEHFDIPSSVTTIETLAFMFCTSLSEITLPEGLKTLEAEAITYCSSLEEIYIPASVEEIGPAAFGYCPKLSSIVVDPNNPYFDSRENCNAIMRTETDTLVGACQSTVFFDRILAIEPWACVGILGFEEIAIPSSVKEIGEYAFYSCENLRHVDFGETSDLRTLSKDAFDCCALEEVLLPEGVETVEEAAFAYCKSLVTLTLPSTVRSIGGNIAYGARNLNEATYRGSVKSWEAIEKDPEWFNGTSCQVVHCQNGDVPLG